MTISALPTPPSRSSQPGLFAEQADAFYGAMPQFAVEANALAADVSARQADITAKQLLTASLASAAQQSRDICQAVADDPAVKDGPANAAIAASAAESAAAAWSAALAANPDLDPVIRMNPSVVRADTTIPAGYNAYSAGPLEIAESTTVTVADTGRWTIL